MRAMSGEWFDIVWYVADMPRHAAVPAKKKLNAIISACVAVSYRKAMALCRTIADGIVMNAGRRWVYMLTVSLCK